MGWQYSILVLCCRKNNYWQGKTCSQDLDMSDFTTVLKFKVLLAIANHTIDVLGKKGEGEGQFLLRPLPLLRSCILLEEGKGLNSIPSKEVLLAMLNWYRNYVASHNTP